MAHESALEQLLGQARFIDDLPLLAGSLHAAPVCSPLAHGRLLGIDASNALQMPGVKAFIQARDLPGPNQIANMARDEPILAQDTLSYAGQVIALVLAQSHREALAAAAKVKLEIEPLPSVLSIEQAMEHSSWITAPAMLERGQPDEAMAKAPHRVSAQRWVGGQEHFYLEGQIAYAIPEEQNAMLVHSSTQHPGEMQHWIAHALELPAHSVRVLCRRMGGGFGGKETQSGQVAVWAAVAANLMGCPVKMRLDRDDDFKITGKRHPFRVRYEVGFDDEGTILALDAELASDCGFSADLSIPVNERALFHVDNAYYIESLRIRSYRCRTNKQSNTAFRGFGGPQGMYLIESAIGDVARYLDQDALSVRLRNVYGTAPRNITPYGMTVEDEFIGDLMRQLADDCRYKARRQAIKSEGLARGIAITPVKFGISFNATHFNQAGALLQWFTDGTLALHHGGTEMGQGLHTKIVGVVCHILGVDPTRVRVMTTDTHAIANASATAASAGSDLNGRATEIAASTLRDRLIEFWSTTVSAQVGSLRFDQGQLFWTDQEGIGRSTALTELVNKAYLARIQLWAEGFYSTPKIHFDPKTRQGRPFYYFSWGAACTEIEVDPRTGCYRMLAVDILHDAGNSLNQRVDRGQVIGGFVQGMGWLSSEELRWHDDGRLLTHAPSTYKIPTARDLPEHFEVNWWHMPNREDNLGGSKAVGEPPLMLALSVIEALRDAVGNIRFSRATSTGQEKHDDGGIVKNDTVVSSNFSAEKTPGCGHRMVHLDAPATPERVFFAIRQS
jgi:xanthine dehydrogenase large subunit